MNPSVFFEAPLIIQVHAVAAILSLLIGLLQFLGPKGTLPHRTLGLAFVMAMMVTATTAIFIRQINDGHFSPIHIFVPLTFLGLYGLVRHAMAHRGMRHGKEARGLVIGALLIPGLLAFLPGRLMWWVVFG